LEGSLLTTRELIENQADLEQRLRVSGPVAFVRELSSQNPGAHILARDSQALPGGRRSTRFIFVDSAGAEALLTVFSEVIHDGSISYSLTSEPREEAPDR
jgi:hypothetical protein